jgi:hypothetical protein
MRDGDLSEVSPTVTEFGIRCAGVVDTKNTIDDRHDSVGGNGA